MIHFEKGVDTVLICVNTTDKTYSRQVCLCVRRIQLNNIQNRNAIPSLFILCVPVDPGRDVRTLSSPMLHPHLGLYNVIL